MPAPAHRGPTRRWWALYAAVLLAHAVVIARAATRVGGRLYFSLFDDAMISMRYAQNLAGGHGLVWNPGQPPVEGITNPLWTLVMAALHLVPVATRFVPLLVAVTASLVVLATVAATRRLAVEVRPGAPVVALAATVLVATYFPLAFWSLRGLEVGLLDLLVTVAALLALRGPGADGKKRELIALAAVTAALPLVRTDAVLPATVVAAFAVAFAGERRRQVALVLGGALVGSVALLTAVRLAYYGDLLPNTYYLKVTGVSAADQVRAGWIAMRHLVVVHLWWLLAPAALGAVGGALRRDRATLLLVALVAVQLGYSVVVGGDAWEYTNFSNRFVSVAAPALALLGAMGLHEVVRGPARRSAAMAAGLMLLVGVGLVRLRKLGNPPGLNIARLDSVEALAPWLMAGAAACFVLAVAVLVALLLPVGPLGRARRDGDPAPARGTARRKARRGLAMIPLLVAVVVATNAQAVTAWYRHNGTNVDFDNAMVAHGLRLRAATRPGATVAIWWAGNAPYYSGRTAIDVLGKSDPVIAHLSPVAGEPRRPGHDKFDLSYSIGRLQPDVVDLGITFDDKLGLGPEALARYRGWGYEPAGGPFLVRVGSTLVDRALLAQPLPAEHNRR